MEWDNNKVRCTHLELTHLLSKEKMLLERFIFFSIRHIFKEQNSEANRSTKKACNLMDGEFVLINKYKDGIISNREFFMN